MKDLQYGPQSWKATSNSAPATLHGLHLFTEGMPCKL